MTTSRTMDATDTPVLSDRVNAIGPSATLAASERARQMRAEGIDVLDLGPGQPDFETPDHIRDAGVRAIREGRTRYTPAAGIPELRAAVADLYSRREGVTYKPEETMITCGGKQGLHNVMMALLNPGDEIVIPTPYWVSFPEQAKMAGAVPVTVDTSEDDGFELRAAAIREACTGRTRMVVVNTPSNPSGAVIARQEMEALAALALERDISALLGLRAEVRHRDGKGSLVLHYDTLEQLDDILARLSQAAAAQLPDPLDDIPIDDGFGRAPVHAAASDGGNVVDLPEPDDGLDPPPGAGDAPFADPDEPLT